jgi:hypothetical protein
MLSMQWRSSPWYITLVVASGTAMEAFTYVSQIPVTLGKLLSHHTADHRPNHAISPT